MVDPQSLLDADDCQVIVEKLLKTKNFKLESFTVSSFHHPMQGMLGDHFTLIIRYHHDRAESEQFFLKALSTNPLLCSFSKTLQVYEKEAFLYQLLEEFEGYKIDTSFAPKGYFFKPYITVLEDLSLTGFEGTPKKRLLDLNHCRVCVETIAKFHAASLIYERRKSDELGRKFSLKDEHSQLLEDKLVSQDDNFASKWMLTSIKGLFQLIDLVPENHVSHDDFKAKLSEILTSGETSDGLISGLVHGDLWTSNFLYSYEDSRPVEGKLVDYQMVKYGPLELDLVEFLMTNTSRDFRNEHFTGLVEHYHTKLLELLTTSGVECGEIADARAFVRSCDNFKLAGKVHAIVDHSFTFMSDEIYGVAMKSEESFERFLFEERGKYVIESYNKNEEFKNVLGDDVLELRDLLFPSERN